MNFMKVVIPLDLLYWSIHTKDESKRGTAFAFIFGVNWLWRCGITASFGVFFHGIKCNGMTSLMEFMYFSRISASGKIVDLRRQLTHPGTYARRHIQFDHLYFQIAGNLHKWMFNPRGCAVFWVSPKFQSITRPLVTSAHLDAEDWRHTFFYQATRDYIPYMLVQEALDFYESVGGMVNPNL